MIAPVLSQASDPTESIRSDPIEFAATCDGSVLAIITGIVGPSYRPLGEIMAFGNGTSVGSLSSGCIEADLALHAHDVRTNGAKVVRYGEGSPFLDLQLPCGGGLEITLLNCTDRNILKNIQTQRSKRVRCAMHVSHDGRLSEVPFGKTEHTPSGLRVAFVPEPRFVVFGSGPEASFFTSLVKAGGYPHHLFAANAGTLNAALSEGCSAKLLHWPAMPVDLEVDDRTAAVLFFHDHSWEPTILARLLETSAFYIGAQGSRRAQEARQNALRQLGVSTGADRVRGPIGIIPSTRDPRTLAVSVLAEVLAASR